MFVQRNGRINRSRVMQQDLGQTRQENTGALLVFYYGCQALVLFMTLPDEVIW
jgi:hypothetical protein